MFCFIKRLKIIRKYKNCDIFKPCNIKIDKSANININGYFNFNFPCILDKKNYLAGELIICKDATLEVKGCFSVYAGSSIAINEGASLILGNGYMNLNSKIRCREKIVIGDGTFISEDVHIRDSDTHSILNSNHVKTQPVYIGKNCKLMYNSYVRPGTIMEDDCVIGFCSEIKHTIMRSGSKISDLAFVGDSIIGKNSRIGSGVIVANRGFNQSNIIIKDEEKNQINLNRETIGIILGDNSRIGSNCTTSPGTFVGKFTWVYPHTCIHGFIPEEKKVYDKQNMIFKPNEKKVLYKATNWNYGSYK